MAAKPSSNVIEATTRFNGSLPLVRDDYCRSAQHIKLYCFRKGVRLLTGPYRIDKSLIEFRRVRPKLSRRATRHVHRREEASSTSDSSSSTTATDASSTLADSSQACEEPTHFAPDLSKGGNWRFHRARRSVHGDVWPIPFTNRS